MRLAEKFLPEEWKRDTDFLKRCLVTVEEKILQNPSDAQIYLEFYFKKHLKIDAQLIANPKMKVDADIAKKSIEAASHALKDFGGFDSREKLKMLLMEVIAKLGLKNGQVLWPIRVALTGEQFSPGVFEVLWALGKEKSLQRLADALKLLT